MAATGLNLRPANGKGGPRGLSEAQIIEALRKTGGNKSAAAQALGVTYGAIFQRVQNHPELAEIEAHAKAQVTDLAVSKVLKRIARDDWSAINLWLRTQAGWRERQELTGADGAPLQVNQSVAVTVVYVDAKPDEGDVL